MERKCVERELKQRIQTGTIRREDVTRRLAELAFGKANDCVRLALEDEPKLDKLDLSLLSEVKRNDKGTVEIKLIDRLQALEQLATVADGERTDMDDFLKALQGGPMRPGTIPATVKLSPGPAATSRNDCNSSNGCQLRP